MFNKHPPFNAVEKQFAQQIFDLMIANPGMTEGQIARQMNTFPRAVKPMLDRMLERGCITRRLSGFVRTYFVSETIVRAAKSVETVAVCKPLSTDYMKMMRFVMNKR